LPKALLLKLAKEGKIPCQKDGEAYRFERSAIDLWLEQIESGEGETLSVDQE
jgi:excisionase family DNA binding protein